MPVPWLSRWFRPRDAEGPVRGRFYERSGACNGCAQCCKDIYLLDGGEPVASVGQFEAMRKAYPEYRAFEPVEETEHGLVFRCANLRPDNTCGEYERRPPFCRDYPSEAGLLLGGKLPQECGYAFRLLKSFEQVMREQA